MSEFAPPETREPPPFELSGRVGVRPAAGKAHMQVHQSEDPENVLSELKALPAVLFTIVQAHDRLLTLEKHPLESNHPHWEFVALDGVTWASSKRQGWLEAAMPFALRERNQNCTHQGMIRFSAGPGGELSPARYQVSSETCAYRKLDLWGEVDLEWDSGRAPDRSRLVASRKALEQHRLPLRKIEQLPEDYPALPADGLRPPAQQLSVYGYVVNGIHYRSDCFTRQGPFPLCSEFALPSYSTAKALLAGMAYRQILKMDAGFADSAVTRWIPECRLHDERWEGVRLRHLSDMNTGLFDSDIFQADEGALKKINGFFIPETHADKLAFACTAYPRKAPPGATQVYHTSDTYLLGVAMSRYLEQRQAVRTDIRQWVNAHLYQHLQLNPVALTTMRTYDETAQPWAGYGLTLTPDDAARLGLFMAAHHADFEQVPNWPAARGERYSNGVWAVDASHWVGCPEPVWIPFMSGYGGITIAMLPHGSVMYMFGDGHEFTWLRNAALLHNIQSWCKGKPS
ncbi:MAG: hypothetical protein HKN15_06895 [Xanthomonadales bacterium]|nr:hypothetical protein [Xanthomonadales bacterium]